MTIDYDANIPRASERYAVMREVPRMKQLTLKVKGKLDRLTHRIEIIEVNEEQRCESQFSRRKLSKLQGDIEMLRRELHRDTYKGVIRLAEIARECATIEKQLQSSDGVCERLEQQAAAKIHEGDAGVPASVVAKRRARRASKASAESRQRIKALKERLAALLTESAEIEEVHRQRLQIARDSRNQLCTIFLIEMHIYLDSARRPKLKPPDISQEEQAEMKIA